MHDKFCETLMNNATALLMKFPVALYGTKTTFDLSLFAALSSPPAHDCTFDLLLRLFFLPSSSSPSSPLLFTILFLSLSFSSSLLFPWSPSSHFSLPYYSP